MCKCKILFVITHPIQYTVPLLHLLSQRKELDILVAYCDLQGTNSGVDTGFGVELKWDIPLLDGYNWLCIPNKPMPIPFGQFFKLTNTGLYKLIVDGEFDAIVTYTGYAYASFWILALAAKRKKVPLLFVTDANQLTSIDGRSWKIHIKKRVLPLLFRQMDAIVVPSSKSVRFMHALGVPKEHIWLTPHAVNNYWWIQQSQNSDREQTRRLWGVTQDAFVVLFCGKLQAWKRPQDVLVAFEKANIPNSYLIFAGEGPLKAELSTRVATSHLQSNVKFLGFVNQSKLPSVYNAADVMVISSAYEAFGLVINEAMLCQCPVITCDRVGACDDLIENGKTGFVYSFADTDALADLLTNCFSQPEHLRQIRINALKRMEQWSPQQHVEVFTQAIVKTVENHQSQKERCST